ncbi:MAG TPA: aldose epimerase, partial [Beutenbergiaceae bacterium]|nr:aldose epimerase [Beutenbergiaceae bacterium]
VWMDTTLGYWQLCTGDELAGGARRTGLAAEPMSCVADAFNTGDDLVHLEPGGDHYVRWGLTLE